MSGPKTRRVLDALPPVGPPGYDPVWDELERDNRPLYYDIEGEPLTMREWTRLWGSPDHFYRRIAWTETILFHVSTVWLGLDHRFGGITVRKADEPYRPIIFESMVFDNAISVSRQREGFTDEESRIHFPPFPDFYYHREQEQRRYETIEQALDGTATWSRTPARWSR